MTAKDIQIDDIFLVQYLDDEWYEGKVKEFDRYTVELELSNGVDFVCLVDELMPILVNSDRLDKYGMKQLLRNSWQMFDLDDPRRYIITIDLGDDAPTMSVTLNDYSDDEVTYFLPTPTTVHQLQHNLRAAMLPDIADNFAI